MKRQSPFYLVLALTTLILRINSALAADEDAIEPPPAGPQLLIANPGGGMFALNSRDELYGLDSVATHMARVQMSGVRSSLPAYFFSNEYIFRVHKRNLEVRAIVNEKKSDWLKIADFSGINSQEILAIHHDANSNVMVFWKRGGFDLIAKATWSSGGVDNGVISERKHFQAGSLIAKTKHSADIVSEREPYVAVSSTALSKVVGLTRSGKLELISIANSADRAITITPVEVRWPEGMEAKAIRGIHIGAQAGVYLSTEDALFSSEYETNSESLVLKKLAVPSRVLSGAVIWDGSSGSWESFKKSSDQRDFETLQVATHKFTNEELERFRTENDPILRLGQDKNYELIAHRPESKFVQGGANYQINVEDFGVDKMSPPLAMILSHLFSENGYYRNLYHAEAYTRKQARNVLSLEDLSWVVAIKKLYTHAVNTISDHPWSLAVSGPEFPGHAVLEKITGIEGSFTLGDLFTVLMSEEMRKRSLSITDAKLFFDPCLDFDISIDIFKLQFEVLEANFYEKGKNGDEFLERQKRIEFLSNKVLATENKARRALIEKLIQVKSEDFYTGGKWKRFVNYAKSATHSVGLKISSLGVAGSAGVLLYAADPTIAIIPGGVAALSAGIHLLKHYFGSTDASYSVEKYQALMEQGLQSKISDRAERYEKRRASIARMAHRINRAKMRMLELPVVETVRELPQVRDVVDEFAELQAKCAQLFQ